MHHIILPLILLLPFSGYQVQFHLVESKTADGLPLIDDEAYEPLQPSSPLVSKSDAQMSMEARSFWLDFEDRTLPNNIIIDQNLLNGALKDGREYALVTVPYTVYTVSVNNIMCSSIHMTFYMFLPLLQKQNESVLLFSRSNLSAIFKTCKFIKYIIDLLSNIISVTQGVLLQTLLD